MADKDVLYHELLEALQADGCAVCRLAAAPATAISTRCSTKAW